jgi:DNA-repair protein XRCC4
MMTIAAFSSVAVVRHSCAKLSVPMDGAKAVAVAVGTVFVKTTWLPSRFSLAMTDGADAEVRLRGE